MIEEKYLHILYKSLQKFTGIQREDFDVLTPFFVLRRFDRREIILEEGETEEYLNMVVEGLVRKFIRVKKREVTIQLATEGHLIQSEISFHERIPSQCVIETIEPSVIVSMQYQHVQTALRDIPQAEELARVIVSYIFIKKDNRMHQQMKYNTRERFLEFVRLNPHMLRRVPQKILASYLNIEPETFSRLKHLIGKAESPESQ